MKFGKIMQNQLDDTIPEWREKFLCYKQLKKRLKSIQAPVCFTEAAFVDNTSIGWSKLKDLTKDAGDEADDGNERTPKRNAVDLQGREAAHIDDGFVHPSPKKRKIVPAEEEEEETLEVYSPTHNEDARDGERLATEQAGTEAAEVAQRMAEDKEFIRLLNVELDKFNHFFMEKEEEYVIRLHQLKERIESVKEECAKSGSVCDRSCEEEYTRIQMDIVTFHGEMVLLENYSSLNYMGLVKILKKHDKRTGAVLRMPFIVSVLHQPFFSTKLLSKLVAECLECANRIRSILPPSLHETVVEEGVIEDASLSQAMESEPIHRQTLAALRTIQAMRRV